MLRSLHTAASGMAAQETRIDVIANNMANAGTTGFRRSRADFQDLLYQQARTPGGRTAAGGVVPTGVQIGQGVRTSSTQLVHTQGALQQTGNPLDLAIEGQGFFQIQRADGTMGYTRAGNLQVDPDGRIVTSDGLPLEPAIVVPLNAASVTIGQDGVVSCTMPGQSDAQEVGRIELATFQNPGGLESLGRNLFRATAATGAAITAQPGQEGMGGISQGYLEGSNVEVVTEMIDLISSQRAYDINQRVIQAADDMLRKTTEGV